MPFCRANWKALFSCAGALAEPRKAAAISAPRTPNLENAIEPAAAVFFLDFGSLLFRLGGSRFAGRLAGVDAGLFGVGIERRFAIVRRAEEKLVGEALVGRLHLAIVRGDLLADAVTGIGGAGLRQQNLLRLAVIAGDGAGDDIGIVAIERGFRRLRGRYLVQRRGARLGRLQIEIGRDDQRRLGDDGEFVRRLLGEAGGRADALATG